MNERRSSQDSKPPTVAVQAFRDLTPAQRNVLFYWALGLITVPAIGLVLLFLLPIDVTWKIVVMFSLPMLGGFFLASPTTALKILDLVLRGLAGLVPALGKAIRPDRRNSH